MGHFLLVFPSMGDSVYGHRPLLAKIIKDTPLRIVWAGHEAVIFFFILSGFVLALHYVSGNAPRYGTFLIRRICRIWIPYLLAVFIALGAYEISFRSPIHGYSVWTDTIWDVPITAGLVVNHFLLLGNFNTTALDPTLWSLIHEMRISLIFPLLMVAVVKWGWKRNLTLAILLSASGYVGNEVFFGPSVGETSGAYLFTLHYASMFIFGALLAKYRAPLIAYVAQLRPSMKAVVLIGGLVMYGYSHAVIVASHLSYNLGFIVNDWMTGVGVMAIILLSLSSSVAETILTWGPIHFFGRISYSLYLLHVVALFSVLYLVHGHLKLVYVEGIAFLVAVFLATLAYKFVEVPSITFGRYLTRGSNKTDPPAIVAQSL